MPESLIRIGGVAKPGVAGTGETRVLIDQAIPTDRHNTQKARFNGVTGPGKEYGFV